MGLFNKKKGVKKDKGVKKETSSLPPLPKLPELPTLDDEKNKLPSFPSDSLGKRFSTDKIKDTVAGGKEGEFLADDFLDEDERRMMQEPSRKPLTEEIGEKTSLRQRRPEFERRSITEPIFIRIDRFEEALRIFNETKKKISEIERILTDIKRIKEKEENELKTWENEISSMKEQIEKVDKDIFSKI
jgi:hypothetical protein